MLNIVKKREYSLFFCYNYDGDSMHKETSKNILFALILNFSFAIIELFGGIFTNSIAIITHSIHDFGDSLSFVISYFFERISTKRPNREYTFGYLRYSLLGALITSLILLFTSLFVIKEAVIRVFNPEEVNYHGMLLFALVGMFINLIAALRTHSNKSIHSESISIHLMEDVLTWGAVLISAILIYLFNIDIIDPILSILISIYIIMHALKHILKVIKIILEKIPESLDVNEISKNLLENTKIEKINHIHIWSLDGLNNYITLHAIVDHNLKNKEIIKIKKDIRKKLKKMHINHITIEIDYDNEKQDRERNI